MLITSLYAAILAIAFVVLSIRTIRIRRRQKIAIGDAGDATMMRAIRVHANFAEYVPFSLVLLCLVEVASARPAIVHALGLCLLVGRASHAFGVSQPNEQFGYRVTGMALTFTTILSCSGILLYLYIANSVT
jgi:uncharacterized membrane protein YecN with MAPEG domain